MSSRLDDLRAVPRAALIIAVIGVVPMVAGAAGLLLGSPTIQANAFLHLLRYAALGLTFLGAAQWGFAVAASARGNKVHWGWYAISVVPIFIAWAATSIVGPVVQFFLLLLGYFIVFMVDLRAIDDGLAPPWYKALRKPLTMVSMMSLAVALWVVVQA
ncbi:MAG: DUF3429 domain-containing protein [Alphaproteobacteria bacterium]